MDTWTILGSSRDGHSSTPPLSERMHAMPSLVILLLLFLLLLFYCCCFWLLLLFFFLLLLYALIYYFDNACTCMYVCIQPHLSTNTHTAYTHAHGHAYKHYVHLIDIMLSLFPGFISHSFYLVLLLPHLFLSLVLLPPPPPSPPPPLPPPSPLPLSLSLLLLSQLFPLRFPPATL